MDRVTDMPTIGGDEDWLELNDGEQGLLKGRLYGTLEPGRDSLIVSTTSWEVIAVGIRGGHVGEGHPAGTPVTIVVTRCEDGLEMQSDDMLVHHEEN